jgi:hypothetical protein
MAAIHRPDVKLLVLSPKVVKLARKLLLDYRTRLCRAGYGPFAGGSTPSSGLVSVRALPPA